MIFSLVKFLSRAFLNAVKMQNNISFTPKRVLVKCWVEKNNQLLLIFLVQGRQKNLFEVTEKNCCAVQSRYRHFPDKAFGFITRLTRSIVSRTNS